MEVGCSEPALAAACLSRTAIGASCAVGASGLEVVLPTGTGQDVVAEINRVLVDGGISVYRLLHVQASLESWFLEVTSRLDEET